MLITDTHQIERTASFSVSISATTASISASVKFRTLPCPSTTAKSMFLAPVCTTSSRDLMVSLTVASVLRSAVHVFSKNSRTVLDARPIALACPLQSGLVGTGSIRGRAHLPSGKDAARFSHV